MIRRTQKSTAVTTHSAVTGSRGMGKKGLGVKQGSWVFILSFLLVEEEVVGIAEGQIGNLFGLGRS